MSLGALERRPFVIGDARLQHMFLRTPTRCASVEEYARAAGMTTDEVLELLSPLLSEGILGLDPVQGTLFVHTAPKGRPAPMPLPQIAANLWELLRNRASLEQAFALWRLIRGLEVGGWTVDIDQVALEARAQVNSRHLLLGIRVRDILVPLVPYPTTTQVPSALDDFAGGSAVAVALTCENRELDQMVTAARAWFLSRPVPARMTVFILEAPSFAATILRCDDNSVTPVVVQRFEP